MSTPSLVAQGRTPLRRAPRLLLGAITAFALFVVAILGALEEESAGTGSFAPSPVAVADIPADYLVLYKQAAGRFGIDWAILAAIGKAECNHGRSQLPGCNPPGTVNSAGATGPMQFLGSTWQAGTPPMTVPPIDAPTSSTRSGYATDGDGDGLADVWNPADAISGAARLLRANGAPAEYRKAIYAYNHSEAYVEGVFAKADEYRGAFQAAASQPALLVLRWAIARVGRFTYDLGPGTDRGGSIADMQSREPVSSTCDCSMYVRWAMAQAGIDPGTSTVTQWTANGLLPDTETATETPLVTRGIGSTPPPGGYRPADMVFFGHGPGGDGHVALWLGNGLLVQCSSSGGGSNIRPLAGYASPTGWIRWRAIGGP